MKAKKIALWVFDTIVFVTIAIYRIACGHTIDHYYYTGLDWYDIAYGGSSTTSVYDEPFFIICMIIMAFYLLVSLVLKIKGTDGDGTLALKFFAYIASLVSVAFMYSGDWDWLIVVVIGFISLTIESHVDEKKKSE